MPVESTGRRCRQEAIFLHPLFSGGTLCSTAGISTNENDDDKSRETSWDEANVIFLIEGHRLDLKQLSFTTICPCNNVRDAQ